MYKKLILALMLTFSATVNAKFISAEHFLQLSNSNISVERGAAIGYVTAIVDNNSNKICLPKDTTNGQLLILVKEIMTDALNKNPEYKKELAADIISFIILNLFPCNRI